MRSLRCAAGGPPFCWNSRDQSSLQASKVRECVHSSMCVFALSMPVTWGGVPSEVLNAGRARDNCGEGTLLGGHMLGCCAPFLRFLDPEFFLSISTISGSRNCSIFQFLDPETAPFLQFLGALWIVGVCLPSPCGWPYGS